MKNIVVLLVVALGLTGCSSLDGLLSLQTKSPNEQVQINAEFDTIKLSGSDGGNVNHYLFKTSEPPIATLFLLPAKNTTITDSYQYIKPLTENGYQVFIMEYRGMTETDIDDAHFGVVSDTVNAVNYLASRKDINNTPIVLLGQSYGAQPAIYASHIKYSVVDALILEGAFTSFRDFKALQSPEFLSSFVSDYYPNVYSGIELIAQVKLPTLVIHSRDDEIVPFGMSEALKSASSSPNAALWEIDGEHLNGLLQRPTEYAEKIKQLISVSSE